MTANALEAIQFRVQQLEALGTNVVPMDDVKALIAEVRGLFGDDVNEQTSLYQQIGELARFINNARKEMYQLDGNDLAENQIPDAAAQLAAVVEMAEKATQRIMDSAEAIQAVMQELHDRLESLGVDPDVLATVDDGINEALVSITNIFEACNFQDITGQRIQKIVTIMQEIERQLLKMVVIFNLRKKQSEGDEAAVKQLQHEVELLNGPQLPGQGLEQGAIDDLLSQLL
jgi:chemotaxis protein CheZ